MDGDRLTKRGKKIVWMRQKMMNDRLKKKREGGMDGWLERGKKRLKNKKSAGDVFLDSFDQTAKLEDYLYKRIN